MSTRVWVTWFLFVFTSVAALASDTRLGRLVAERDGIEGAYSVMVGEKPGTLTIAHMGSDTFLMGLTIPIQFSGSAPSYLIGEGLNYSFFDVGYNAREDSWDAQHLPASSPSGGTDPFFLNIKLSRRGGGNSIAGEFINLRGPQNLRGYQTERFYDPGLGYRPPAGPIPAMQPWEGTYRGRVGNGKPFVLSINRVGARLIGTIAYAETANVVFIYSTADRVRRTLYLTTGELDSGRWAQMRLFMSVDGKSLRGVYLIGGEGTKFKLSLTRFNRP